MTTFEEFRKDRNKDAKSGAIQGAGATVAGVGAVAGGVPGARANFGAFMRGAEAASKEKKAAKKARKFAGGAVKAAPGGILGFRTSAHRGGTYGFAMDEAKNATKGARTSRDYFKHGRNAGKIEPELKIIRHMQGGKKVAAGALVGGSAAAAYGHRKGEVKKSKRDKQYGQAAGAGAAGYVVASGGGRVLRGQEKSWRKQQMASQEKVGRLIPGLKGMKDSQVRRNLHHVDNAKPSVAQAAGRHIGNAAQAEHFADVYRSTGKVVRAMKKPSAVVGAVGAGGVAAGYKKDRVKKSGTVSAFGVDHG